MNYYDKYNIEDIVIVNGRMGKRTFNNMIGRVVRVTDYRVGIEFDEELPVTSECTEQHDCKGNGKYGHCWNFFDNNAYNDFTIEKYLDNIINF